MLPESCHPEAAHVEMAKRFPLLITVLSALFVGAAANEVSRMERVVRSYVACKTFVGSVLVAKGDKVVLSEGYGLASAETALSNTPATKFRIGSITKQFTAASILLLEEQGKLKVEDPVKKYLPDAPAEWEKISIFNLLTHTAGIPDLT